MSSYVWKHDQWYVTGERIIMMLWSPSATIQPSFKTKLRAETSMPKPYNANIMSRARFSSLQANFKPHVASRMGKSRLLAFHTFSKRRSCALNFAHFMYECFVSFRRAHEQNIKGYVKDYCRVFSSLFDTLRSEQGVQVRSKEAGLGPATVGLRAVNSMFHK